MPIQSMRALPFESMMDLSPASFLMTPVGSALSVRKAFSRYYMLADHKRQVSPAFSKLSSEARGCICL